MEIKYTQKRSVKEEQEKFSIIIPTWNNLDYVKLCVESILKNSSFKHEIILHINDGSDGTRDWAASMGLAYSSSPENVGICWAVNAAASLATTDYIVYMNDDMYVCPEWDRILVEEIDQLDTDQFFLSSTMLEPKDTNNPCVVVAENYGDSIESFKEEELLRDYKKITKENWSGATWPPNVVTRKMWNEIGGYSVEFSPGMYSDPDFSMKLWQRGVRVFKGMGESRVFHFQCKSTGRIIKNDGKTQFLNKWSITGSRFIKQFLKRGEPYSGILSEPEISQKNKLLDKFRQLFS